MMHGIEIQTNVRAYCDGALQNHTRFVIDGQPGYDAVYDAVAEAGFVVLEDGRVYCKAHRP